MENSKEGLIVPLLLAITTILVVGGGVYVYTQDQPTTASQNANTEATSTVQSSPGTQSTTSAQVITPKPSPTPPKVKPACVRGGCSGQVCAEERTDGNGLVTTCEYRAEYACYDSARCERQSTGACGWTSTLELSACLSNPPSL